MIGKNKDEKPSFNTLNVIKNAILCYYNRVLKKKFQISILIKKVRKHYCILEKD